LLQPERCFYVFAQSGATNPALYWQDAETAENPGDWLSSITAGIEVKSYQTEKS